MAWKALVHRFKNTWCSWMGSARARAGSRRMSSRTVMLRGSEAESRLKVSRTTSATFTASNPTWDGRLKARICRTSWLPRWLALSTRNRSRVISEPSGESRRASSAEFRMVVRMLLKSCAMPPASVPMASIFWDCSSMRWVMSSTMPS